MRPFASLMAALVAVVMSPAVVEAHLVTTGLGPVYDGISHVLLSPDDLVPVLAMGLLGGLNGATAGRLALFVLPAAWLLGGVAGMVAGGQALPLGLTTASFLVLGAMTALDRRLPSAMLVILAAMVGLLHGWLNGAAMAEAEREGLGLIGIASAIFVLAALTSGLVVSLRAAWARVAVRVVGSWVAAVGLLMLGWSLSGR